MKQKSQNVTLSYNSCHKKRVNMWAQDHDVDEQEVSPQIGSVEGLSEDDTSSKFESSNNIFFNTQSGSGC